jgi:hypothetical protein
LSTCASAELVDCGSCARGTPAADGKMAARIDFAGGAYVMTGTATKKEKAR